MWRKWIEDEKKLATTSEEKKSLNELFEKALKDYQCKYLSIFIHEKEYSTIVLNFYVLY